MATLEGTDKRHFRIVPHPTVKGENVLGEFVASLSAGGKYVCCRYWTFGEVYEALEHSKRAQAQG